MDILVSPDQWRRLRHHRAVLCVANSDDVCPGDTMKAVLDNEWMEVVVVSSTRRGEDGKSIIAVRLA